MVSALELIHSCAELAGRFEAQLTTSDGTTSSLVCSRYVNSVLNASEYANFAVLIESGCCAGEQGMLTNAGLANTTGTFSTADQFTQAIASGVAFSLYDRHRLPAYRKGVRTGWLEIANQALERTWFEDTLSILGVTSQIHYTIDLTPYPWFTDDTRIVEIQRPVVNADDVPVVMSRNAWSWVSDGETRRLRFPGAPFRTGETFTIKVNRPGNSRLKLNATARAVLTATAVTSAIVTAGGYYTALPTITPTFGAATFTAVMSATPGAITSVVVNTGGAYSAGFPPGLTITRNASDTGWVDKGTQTAKMITLTDECIPDVRILRPAMLALGFKELAKIGAPGQSVKEWNDSADEWEAKAVGIKIARTPRDANEGVIRLRSSVVGGRSSRYGGRWY